MRDVINESNVDDLYGPGALIGWLLIFCSVIVSWSLNSKTKEDELTMDFITALTLPAVAAGHLTYAYIHDTDQTGPWYVCSTFNPIGYSLALSSGFSGNWKRSSLVTFVFMLSMILERCSVLHTPNPWEPLLDVAHSITAFYILVLGFDFRREPHEGLFARTLRRVEPSPIWSHIVSFCLHGGFFVSLFSLCTWLVGFIDALKSLPLTIHGFAKLDQAVALAGGVVTLGFSVWDAVRSRRVLGGSNW